MQQRLATQAQGTKIGAFVSKHIKGQTYWYFQTSIGTRKTQTYLGKETPEMMNQINRIKANWSKAEPAYRERQKQVAMIRAGGGIVPTTGEAKILELLEQLSVFDSGGVLIGTQAFTIYGNMLGVHWNTAYSRTSDIDIADDAMKVGIAHIGDLETRLKNSELDLQPILNLQNQPSSSFHFQKEQIHLEFLTPMYGPERTPIMTANLKIRATGLRFLDFLLEETEPAVVIAKSGILVSVPNPGRFAIHKLVVSERRRAFEWNKAKKDRIQAQLLIEHLLKERPGDLHLAMEAAQKMPKKFQSQLAKGLQTMPPDLIAGIM
ncbi:MAG: hypothetical protein CSA81_11245 [Acidobacteria bacterium]|nr:MAG: hypothetical protein CSA81_11245 [Acidobacteriota bacterium]PIE89950.1 MAG: hypothetical protein CR997_08205 [Acidobacteriota bacterium]